MRGWFKPGVPPSQRIGGACNLHPTQCKANVGDGRSEGFNLLKICLDEARQKCSPTSCRHSTSLPSQGQSRDKLFIHSWMQLRLSVMGSTFTNSASLIANGMKSIHITREHYASTQFCCSADTFCWALIVAAPVRNRAPLQDSK